MNLLLVFNPRAASGRAARQLPAIQAELQARGIACETVLTSAPGHATDYLARRDLRSFDGVVAAGGDGTVFETVNGLYGNRRGGHAQADGPPMGVLPIGTGNAFARDLGLQPGDWREALKMLAKGRQRRVDVGQVTTGSDRFWFLNIIGLGFVVDAARTATRLKGLGNGAYTLAALWQALKLKSLYVSFDADGRAMEHDAVFVEISNTRYTGTHFLIAPSAQMDDGLLDVTVLRKLPRRRLLWLFPSIYSGSHVEFDEVEVMQARRIHIRTPAGCSLIVDGEFRGETPAEITCLPQDLAIFC